MWGHFGLPTCTLHTAQTARGKPGLDMDMDLDSGFWILNILPPIIGLRRFVLRGLWGPVDHPMWSTGPLVHWSPLAGGYKMYAI